MKRSTRLGLILILLFLILSLISLTPNNILAKETVRDVLLNPPLIIVFYLIFKKNENFRIREID